MDVIVTRKIRYHGWTLPTGKLTGVIRMPSGSLSAPHPHVKGAFIDLPLDRVKVAD